MNELIKLKVGNCLMHGLAVLSAGLLWIGLSITPVLAETSKDAVLRTAVVSSFSPEIVLLKSELEDASSTTINGVDFLMGKLAGNNVVLFLSGISMVNSSMTVQLALNHFNIEQIIFTGIAGGVDPGLDIGDVVIADRWGQYLEMLYARQVDSHWEKVPFFEYPHANFGMMFPRSLSVVRDGLSEPETRFWFPVDESLFEQVPRASNDLELKRCTDDGRCLPHTPQVVIGCAGVSGSAFIDNAEFREYVFRAFESRVLDMESAAVAHVAWANHVPFLAIRSISDLAGAGGHENQIEIFTALAADNSAKVLLALLENMNAN